jgi:anthranilate synthase/indole-3-glycerol phosphate synthase/phosphoribosylanthranilate isomerase
MGYTLIIDNYDSFTWNVYADVAVLSGNPLVKRNDKITIEEIQVSRVQVCATMDA